ncbi:MAG TPA: PKD domain-containing protein [Chitinophagaceae bacterium]
MKRLARICCLLLSFCLFFGKISAQDYSNLELVENKGQWPSQVKFKATIPSGAFFLMPDGYRMLLHNQSDLNLLSETMHGGMTKTAAEGSLAARGPESPEYDGRVVLHSHAYDMKFLHASPNAEIIADKPVETFANYFLGNDPSKWASNCRVFQGVTYRNVYPGVDVRYYTNEGRLKYDIIVNPGASAGKIAMYFEGTDGLSVKEGRLVVKTSVDEVQELRPYTYQPLASGRKEIANNYEVDGNIVRFKLGSYDRTKTLVIDPTLIFSTFSGSTTDNWGFTATYDNSGNFYGGGIVFAPGGFPTSPGAFQTTFQGGAAEGQLGMGYDIGIIKLNANGSNRIYATYIGGSANEQPHSLIVDAQGNLVIGGRTFSSNYPGTGIGPRGQWDIVLTKLNATGSGLVGSLIIGGTNNDGVNIRPKTQPGGATSILRNYGDDARSEVMIDAAGNVYLASCTMSDNFPVTPGVFQGTKAASQDGVLIKTTPDLNTILFSSFLGGNGDDATFVLALNPTNGNIYTAGGTTSTDLPKATAGAAISQTFLGGVADGFVAIVSPDGTNHIKSTYLGTSQTDIVYGIQFDHNSFPYVMGTTTGSWQAVNAAFSVPNGRQFIAKLQPDLSGYVYSTSFGKTGTTPGINPDISPVAFLVDRCENVYVSGWGGSINSMQGFPSSDTKDLPVTSNAIRSTSDGSDFYIFVLAKNATSQLYGTYWGAINAATGDHVDGGTSRFDENGVIYMAQCGHCGGGGTFPTTAGSWSTTNKAIGGGGGGQCNLAMVKIAMELAGVSSAVKSFVDGTPRKQGCIPLTVDFTDTLSMGQQYIWNFGDGSPEVTTTTASVAHTYNAIGTYNVRLITVDSNTCNIRDTSYTNITARIDNARLDFTYEKLPPCDNLSFRFTNTSIPPAPPGKPFTNQSFRWDFGDGVTLVAGLGQVTHTYAAKGTYNVKLSLIDTNYCNYPDDTVKVVRISENVDAQFTTPPFGCVPYTAVFDNTSAGGQQFYWDFGDGTTSNDAEPTHVYNTPGNYTIRLRAVDSATCNIEDSTSFSIVVSGSPTAAFVFTPDPPEINGPVDFINNSTGGVSYLWNFGDGDTLFTTRKDTTVRHFYNASGTFNTCLLVTNQYGCTDTACATVVARVVPALDVPNAFTPNNDGLNDKVYVRGFAIGKMTWRIYNRWGQLVFMTQNRFEGWDGRYKGVLQPQEVYTYTLDIEFTDGTKAIKTGDITLLR